MESVVATVSGYHRSERFNLIKLISHICWRFEGRKYKLAKKLKRIIVNHRWIEDCRKEGKLLPEDRYMLQSGEEMGPLSLEIPDVAKRDALIKKCKVFSHKSNVHDEVGNKTSDVGYGGSGLYGWSKSALLDEHGESSSYASMPTRRNKRKTSKNKEPNAYCYTELVREERNIPNGSRGTSLVKSSHRKGQRLVKNVNREIVVSDLSDSDQECYPLSVHKQYRGVINLSDHSLVKRAVSLAEIGGWSTYDFRKHRGVDEEVEEVGEIKLRNHQPPTKDSISPGKDAPSVSEGTSADGCSDAERVSQDVCQMKLASRFLSSMEVSCVIYWTEFSPTRGVLPCGHRFCYSCIQEWADHMTSRRKASTCPLCRANFRSITEVEDVAICDQKIFSQTIPYATSTIDVPILPVQERPGFVAQVEGYSNTGKKVRRD